MASGNILKRYTNLASLLYILEKQSVTLLTPHSWADQNDTYFLEAYRMRKGLKCVLALCLTEARETFHHWKVFADGTAGVSLHFYKDKLIEDLKKNKRVKGRKVKYMMVDELVNKKPQVGVLPFVKRLPYEDEKEYRFIYNSPDENLPFLDLPFDKNSLEKVALPAF